MAAGLCVLSVTLVLSGFGGTVAAADTETDGSVNDVHGLTGTTGNSVSRGDVEKVPRLRRAFHTARLFESAEGKTSPDNTAGGTGEEEPTGLTGPMALGVSAGSETGTDAASADAHDNTSSDMVPADATADMHETEVVSHSPVTEPSSAPEPDAPGAGFAPPAGGPPAEQSTVVQPVTRDVVSAGDSSAQIEAAPSVVGPAAAGNLIAVLSYLFIGSPGEHAPFLTLHGSLLSLLGFPLAGQVGAAPITAGGIGGSLPADGMPTAAATALESSLAAPAYWPEMLIASGASGGLSPAEKVLHRALEGISATGVKEEHLSMALTDSVVPEQVRSVLRHAVGAVLAPLSLLALALMASPGVAGLVLLGAAGTFLGYRQARAASVLRAVGIGRFVKAGPLGVVRSGGLVAVHTRPVGPDRRQSRSTATLESVA
jgi:hypothetical protein